MPRTFALATSHVANPPAKTLMYGPANATMRLRGMRSVMARSPNGAQVVRARSEA